VSGASVRMVMAPCPGPHPTMPADDPTDVMSKRQLLQFGVHRAKQAGAVAARFAAEQMADRFTPRVSRPPGAIPEIEFLLACTRCSACVKACPVGAILELDTRAGLAAGTPFIDANRARPCVACSDAPCMPACPTGALQVIDIANAVMGFAELDRDTCRAWTGTACDKCHRACPYPDDAILVDEDGRPFVDPRSCIGCGLCRAACPTRPKSIEIVPPPRF